jgi:hypothetical protein
MQKGVYAEGYVCSRRVCMQQKGVYAAEGYVCSRRVCMQKGIYTGVYIGTGVYMRRMSSYLDGNGRRCCSGRTWTGTAGTLLHGKGIHV